MNCNQKDEYNESEIKKVEVVLIDEVDEEPSPPPEILSSFKTLQEWLFNVCEKENPKTKIATYQFGLSESPGDYMLFVVGLNTYEKNENHLITNIVFEPSDMYFQLPKNEYENLDRAQVLDKIKSQLKDFTKTQKFKASFFAQAKSIKTSFDDDEIWTK